MTTKRKRAKAIVPPRDLHEAETIMAKYAAADSKLQQTTAQMEEEIIKIREKYSVDIHEANEVREENFKKLQAFSEAHEELFQKKKSFNMSQGVLGFRTGTPKLKTKKGFTWAACVKLLKAGKKGKDYIKTVEQPMKDRLLADRDKEATQILMENCGIDVVQDESFYIDLKKEEVEAVS